jgi:hypothetical protein
MLCQEKGALLETYVLTARKFAEAVSRLSDSLLPEDFESAHRSAEEILQDLAAAKNEASNASPNTRLLTTQLSLSWWTFSSGHALSYKTHLNVSYATKPHLVPPVTLPAVR